MAAKEFSHCKNFPRELNDIDIERSAVYCDENPDKNGHSALQYQFLQGVTPELKMTGPGPGE